MNRLLLLVLLVFVTISKVSAQDGDNTVLPKTTLANQPDIKPIRIVARLSTLTGQRPDGLLSIFPTFETGVYHKLRGMHDIGIGTTFMYMPNEPYTFQMRAWADWQTHHRINDRFMWFTSTQLGLQQPLIENNAQGSRVGWSFWPALGVHTVSSGTGTQYAFDAGYSLFGTKYVFGGENWGFRSEQNYFYPRFALRFSCIF
jgi:hypothetical protein